MQAASSDTITESDEKEEKPTLYAWLALAILLCVRSLHYGARQSIGYAFGFLGQGDMYSEQYMIRLAYPQLQTYYGIIASLFLSVPYSIFGIFGGSLTETKNRKYLLALSCIGWSLCTYGTGFFNSLLMFSILRFSNGIFMSMNNPASYALVADYFP